MGRGGNKRRRPRAAHAADRDAAETLGDQLAESDPDNDVADQATGNGTAGATAVRAGAEGEGAEGARGGSSAASPSLEGGDGRRAQSRLKSGKRLRLSDHRAKHGGGVAAQEVPVRRPHDWQLRGQGLGVSGGMACLRCHRRRHEYNAYSNCPSTRAPVVPLGASDLPTSARDFLAEGYMSDHESDEEPPMRPRRRKPKRSRNSRRPRGIVSSEPDRVRAQDVTNSPALVACVGPLKLKLDRRPPGKSVVLHSRKGAFKKVRNPAARHAKPSYAHVRVAWQIYFDQNWSQTAEDEFAAERLTAPAVTVRAASNPAPVLLP